jgi:hypothetical protein
MTHATESNTAEAAVQAADRLMDQGQWVAALQLLNEANRRDPNPELEQRCVVARHRGFVAPVPTSQPTAWPPDSADIFPNTTSIPEISLKQLDATSLASALGHHGALLVRGLLSPTTAGLLRDDIRRAFEAAAASHAGAPVSETAPWYVPFEPGEGYDFGTIERQFFRFGAVLACEAPRPLFHVIEALSDTPVIETIAEYFGEWPALSAKKTSLRRAQPDSQSEWHQDGAFLGDGTRTVNVWTALTPCGVDAPSVDVFARRFGTIVATGTEDAAHTWSVSRAEADRLGTQDVVRPKFDAGDALLFDQFTLHRTAASPTMTRERYAVESWFFAPSTYPYEQIPLLF